MSYVSGLVVVMIFMYWVKIVSKASSLCTMAPKTSGCKNKIKRFTVRLYSVINQSNKTEGGVTVKRHQIDFNFNFISIHCPPKVWKRPRISGFGQYWHESFLICDNFALIRDNTKYENIFYYIKTGHWIHENSL